MKRLLSLLLILALSVSLFCITGCEVKEQIERLNSMKRLEESIEKTGNLTDYHTTIDMAMDVQAEAFGTKIDTQVPIIMDIRLTDIDDEAPQTYVEASYGGTPTIIYSDSIWVYTYADDEGSKELLDREDNLFDNIEEILEDIPSDIIDDIEFEMVDGLDKATVAPPNDIVTRILNELVNEFEDSTIQNITASNSVLTAIIDKDGYISHLELTYDFTAEMKIAFIGTIPATGSAVAKIDLADLGQEVIVTPPQGYETYPEK